MLPEPHAWQRQRTGLIRLTRAEMASSASRQQNSPTKEVCLAWHRKKKKPPVSPSQASWRGSARMDKASPVTDDLLSHSPASLTKIRTCILLRRRSAANTKPDADVAPVACPGIPRTPEAQPAFWKPLLVSIPVSEQHVCDPETGLDESLFVPVLHRVLAAGINPPGGSMRDVRAIRCHLVRDWLGCRDASGKSLPPAWRNEGMREWDRARSVHGRNRPWVLALLALWQLLGWSRLVLCWCGWAILAGFQCIT